MALPNSRLQASRASPFTPVAETYASPDSDGAAPTERDMRVQASFLGSKAYAPDLWTFFMGQFARRVIRVSLAWA